MKFKLIRKVDGEVNCYGKMCKTGGTIDLTGPMAIKADNNPDFQKAVKKAVKKSG